MYPHRIRLRQPWECERLEGQAGVRYLRKFGAPNLQHDFERTWLTIRQPLDDGTLTLNGHELGKIQKDHSFETEVTILLGRRNELQVEFPSDLADASIPGDVAVEIRCKAYLGKVLSTFDETDRLRLSCVVFGSCESTLELYALVAGKSVIYSPVSPDKLGKPIQLVSESPCGTGEARREVRVELINAATVWYRWDSEP